MKKGLEKILNDLELLSLSGEELEKLKNYKEKLKILDKFVSDNEYIGTPEIMIKATNGYLDYFKKVESSPTENFNYLNMKFSNMGWKNESFIRNTSLGEKLIEDIELLINKCKLLYCAVLTGYASALNHQGNHEACIATFEKVKKENLQFDKTNPTIKQINILGCMHNDLGLAYRYINEVEKARYHFEKCFKILHYYKKENTFNAAKIAVTMNIASLYEKEEEIVEALKHLEANEKYLNKFLNDKPVAYTIFHACQLLLMQSKLYWQVGDFKRQKKCLTKVEKMLPQVKDHFKEITANYYFKKALFLSTKNNFEKALATNQKAYLEIFKKFKSTNIKDTPKIVEEDLQINQIYVIQAFVQKAKLLLLSYENKLPKEGETLNLCLDVVDKIAVYFDTKRKNYKGQSTKFSLGFYSKRLYNIGQKACWYLYKETSKVEFSEKAFAYANSSKALVLLEEMNQKWFNNSEQNISIDKIESTLNNNETLIEYSVSEMGVFIYCVSKRNEVQFFYLNKERKETLEQQVKDWLSYHFNIYSPTKYVQYQNEAHQIYDGLLGEFFKEIKEGSTIIISPDGFLNALPFEALVYQKNELNTYNDIAYIIDQFTIGYTFSSYLLYLNRRKKYNRSNKKFLHVSPNFLGNKTLEEHQQIAREQELLLKRASLTEMNYVSAPSIAFNSEKLDLSLIDDDQQIVITKAMLQKLINNNKKKQDPKALIYNAALIKILKKLVNTYFKKTELLNDRQANKAMFTKKVAKAGYVLISSHAEEENGILLYDENGETITFLTYENITKLNMQTQLVILNMCDSGRGKNIFGEGYLSLGRAFFAAGSLNVIQTLYKVSDKLSANLMVVFFAYLIDEKLDFYTALRKAKLLLRKEKGSHPKFWAGHVIYGKNGQL